MDQLAQACRQPLLPCCGSKVTAAKGGLGTTYTPPTNIQVVQLQTAHTSAQLTTLIHLSHDPIPAMETLHSRRLQLAACVLLRTTAGFAKKPTTMQGVALTHSCTALLLALLLPCNTPAWCGQPHTSAQQSRTARVPFEHTQLQNPASKQHFLPCCCHATHRYHMPRVNKARSSACLTIANLAHHHIPAMPRSQRNPAFGASAGWQNDCQLCREAKQGAGLTHSCRTLLASSASCTAAMQHTGTTYLSSTKPKCKRVLLTPSCTALPASSASCTAAMQRTNLNSTKPALACSCFWDTPSTCCPTQEESLCRFGKPCKPCKTNMGAAVTCDEMCYNNSNSHLHKV